MKPAPRNRFLRAAAIAALVTPIHAAEVVASFGLGADTYLSNDSNSGPTATRGTGGLNLRYNVNSRSRQPLIRFDLNGLDAGSNLTGATLRLNLSISNRARTVTIYGLRDQTLDSWDEATTSYANAPGSLYDAGTNVLGTYHYDIHNETTNPTGKWQQLGTLNIPTGNGSLVTSATASLNLDSFLAADTNGLVSFLIISGSDSAPDWWISSKEDASSSLRPTLILPNATSSDSDGDGLADDWEMLHFANLDQSGTGDPDLDTFNNEAEETAGSNPNLAASTPLDIDGDGLPDLWEDLHFGNNDAISTQVERALQGATGDPDADLNQNLAEFTNASNPNDRNSFHDSDTDGLNDAWETLHFGDLATATSTSGDNDGDTYDNAAEYAAKSNPNLAASIPGDIDGDTLGDEWEIQYFANLTTTNDPLGDPDSDTFTNKQEESSTPIKSNPQLASSIPGDSDGDGLSDLWELNSFTSITQYNGLHDPDADLYNNEEEETAGTDPLDNMSFIDSDADSLNDRWEIRHFTHLTTASDPSADPDNDSHTNEDEYLALSSPTNAQSTPTDTDADGLGDAWELLFFPDIFHASATDDNDRDFSNNLAEFTANTSPTNRAISPDSDTDGLGDGWEIFSFGNLTTTDNPEGDNDSDTFTNAAEYAAASNGNSPVSTPDTDGDGLPDGWETLHFTDITAQAGGGDPDGDSANNLLELLAGTNPASNTSTPNPAIVGTAFGRGADTSLSNDVQSAATGPTVISGAAASMTSRDNRASRLHIPMFRFDVSQLGGNLSNTALRLNVTFASPSNNGTLEVFGLVDSHPNESWAEATTNYLTAPGIIEADRSLLNVWARAPQQVRYLGTITVPAIGLALSDPATLDLKSFIEQDTDGQITLFLRAPTNRWYGLSTKENNPELAPAIVAPLGEIIIPADIRITHVALDAAANQFSMVTTGLIPGASYHIQSMKGNETTFTAIAGSTFSGVSSPQTVTVAADEAVHPRQFFRIVEGATP